MSPFVLLDKECLAVEVRLRGGVADREGAVLVHALAVDGDGAIAHLDDHVPVDRAVVLVPRVRVARPDGEVDRPAHLLVEQDGPGRRGDTVVGPDPELAQQTGAIVLGQRGP